MSDIVSPLLQWLNANPESAGIATFLISASESVAIIGTIVPGSVTMTAIGALAGAGVIPLWATLVWAILGAIVGDGISYWIGHYFKDSLRKTWLFRNNPGLLKSGESFVHKYGVMSVFIGRFVGPVRALVPLVAGMLGMKPLQFTIANVASAIGWAPAYMLPGIMLGAASLELPPDIAMHVMLALLMMFLFIVLCIWFTYKLIQLVQKQINHTQKKMWRSMKKSRFFSPVTFLLKHHDIKNSHGQLNLAIYFIIASTLFICLALYVKVYGASNIMVNDAMFHLFRSIRSPHLDDVMIYITLLGQKQVILPVILIVFGWLIYSRRWRVAFHALALGIMAAGSIFVLKNLIQSPRPWGIAKSLETFSMPSGHVTMSTTVYFGLAFLIATSIKPNRRWMIYSLAVIISLAIGISRLYLGAHWFTDVLAAWLLSASLLMLVIISYLRQKEQPLRAGMLALITIVALSITLLCYHARHIDALKAQYTQETWPIVPVSMNLWWQKNDVMPTYHVSLFGFPSQKINIEWAGNLDQIRETLLKQGWTNPPARDWISTLHRITDISSTEYLPLVSPQYLDKKPALILTRRAIGIKSMLVIRLWDPSRMISENNNTIWVGTVSTVPRSYSWIIKKNLGDINIDSKYVFPEKSTAAEWQSKIITMNLESASGKPGKQNIMLVRKNNFVIHKKK